MSILSVHQTRKTKDRTAGLAEKLGRLESANAALVLMGSGAADTESCGIFDMASLRCRRLPQHCWEDRRLLLGLYGESVRTMVEICATMNIRTLRNSQRDEMHEAAMEKIDVVVED